MLRPKNDASSFGGRAWLSLAGCLPLLATVSLAQEAPPAQMPASATTQVQSAPAPSADAGQQAGAAPLSGDAAKQPVVAPVAEAQVKQALQGYLPAEVLVRSLFFTPEEIMYLHTAAKEYNKRKAGELAQGEFNEADFISQLTNLNGAPKARYYTYPQFFLSSLVYRTAGDWSAWLNNVKLSGSAAQEPVDIPVSEFKSSQETTPERAPMKVVSIGKDAVTFEWHPVSMRRINETVGKIAPEKADARVAVDEVANTVRFTLRANQTFSSYSMSVVEGEVVPVTVSSNLSYTPPSASAKAKENPAAKAEDKPKNDEDRRGLKGLIGAYENIGEQQKENQ